MNIKRACDLLGIQMDQLDSVTSEQLNEIYKMKVTNSTDDLEKLYYAYQTIKNRNNLFYNSFLNPFFGFDDIFDRLNNQINYLPNYSNDNMSGSYDDFKTSGFNNNDCYQNNYYSKSYSKFVTNKDGKIESKIYKEVNNNGNKFIEEKYYDGNETKIKRILPNGEIKEFTSNNLLN